MDRHMESLQLSFLSPSLQHKQTNMRLTPVTRRNVHVRIGARRRSLSSVCPHALVRRKENEHTVTYDKPELREQLQSKADAGTAPTE